MNRIPVLGWIASFFLNLFLSIPFWFVWTVCGIGRHFFSASGAFSRTKPLGGPWTVHLCRNSAQRLPSIHNTQMDEG